MSFFDKTVEKAKTFVLNKGDQYYLDGLYKKVKEGDAPTDNSSITDPNELAIWNEWNKNGGMNQETAMNKYCDYISLIIDKQRRDIYKYN